MFNRTPAPNVTPKITTRALPDHADLAPGGYDLRPIIALLAERDPGLHLAVEALFLRDDLRCGAVLGDLVRHRVTGESIRIAQRRKM